jgi:hypothetical protein
MSGWSAAATYQRPPWPWSPPPTTRLRPPRPALRRWPSSPRPEQTSRADDHQLHHEMRLDLKKRSTSASVGPTPLARSMRSKFSTRLSSSIRRGRPTETEPRQSRGLHQCPNMPVVGIWLPAWTTAVAWRRARTWGHRTNEDESRLCRGPGCSPQLGAKGPAAAGNEIPVPYGLAALASSLGRSIPPESWWVPM